MSPARTAPPAHYNPAPKFGLRVARTPEPNVAIYRSGAFVGFAYVDPGFLPLVFPSPPLP